MKIFCEGSKCATLIIRIPGQAPLSFISKSPPIRFVGNTKKYSQYFNSPLKGKDIDQALKNSSNRSSPAPPEYDCSFEFMVEEDEEIIAIDTPLNYSICPYYETRLYFPEPEAVRFFKNGQLRVEGKRVYWDKTDSEHLNGTIQDYLDYAPTENRCAYIIHFNSEQKLRIEFLDNLGTLFSAVRDEDDFSYEVICDICCTEEELLCDSSSFPGYKCVPIQPITDRLSNMENQLKREK
jgi:hypothetical protein